MTKKELLARIERLEAQVTMLAAQVAQQRAVTSPYTTTTPYYPNTYPQTTCGGSVGPADRTLVAINGGAPVFVPDDEAAAALDHVCDEWSDLMERLA